MNPADEQKIEEIYSLPCGRIIIFSHRFYEHKHKFNILIYKDINANDEKQIHCMTINSKISEYHKKIHREKDYVLMQLKDYKFLDKDSHINCINIRPIAIQSIVSQYDTLFLRRDKDAKISRQIRDDILQVMERSRHIDKGKMNKIISGLKSVYNDEVDVLF